MNATRPTCPQNIVMPGSRDASPVRQPYRRTEFYKCRNTGRGWSVMQTSSVEHGWRHFDVEHDAAMQPLGVKTAMAEFRKALEIRLKSRPFYTAVFEYDLVAPSEIILVVWVGMVLPKDLPRATLVGKYVEGCRWPSDMTSEQYRKTQEY